MRRVADQKKRKKSSQITPSGCGLVWSFWGTILAPGVRGFGTTGSHGADLGQTIQGERPKTKCLRREIMRFVMTFTRVFLFYNKSLLTLGGHKQYFEGTQAPKCPPLAPGLLLSFVAQSSLRGAQAKIWRDTAPKCSPWHRA